MKKSTRIFIQKKSKNSLKYFLEELERFFVPIFVFDSELDSKHFQNIHISDLLVNIFDAVMRIYDINNANAFLAESITPQKIIVEHEKKLKIWGVIRWKKIPSFYEINKTKLDPFYLEFQKVNDKLHLHLLCFGDEYLTNLNKQDWTKMDLAWIHYYNFNKMNKHL
ncbi:MAG: hypothetical protein OHK0038_27720 [Flammeovirgaceae bacterium]